MNLTFNYTCHLFDNFLRFDTSLVTKNPISQKKNLQSDIIPVIILIIYINEGNSMCVYIYVELTFWNV